VISNIGKPHKDSPDLGVYLLPGCSCISSIVVSKHCPKIFVGPIIKGDERVGLKYALVTSGEFSVYSTILNIEYGNIFFILDLFFSFYIPNVLEADLIAL